MVFSDALQRQIAHSQNYILMSYLLFLPVAFHFLYAAPSRVPIRYPNTNYEVCHSAACLLLYKLCTCSCHMHGGDGTSIVYLM